MNIKQLLEIEPLDDSQIAEMNNRINELYSERGYHYSGDTEASDLISDLKLNEQVLAAHQN